MREWARLCGATLVAIAISGGVATAAETAALYNIHCALCHQAAGAGATAQFPRLAGRVGAIAADPKGRAYLVQVVHNGLSGMIVVDGAPLTGIMPAQSQLTPDDIARILNYLLTLPPAPHAHPKSFTAAEIASLSSGSRSRDELLAERKALVDARVIP
jgi:mono/diheme cytochrome c family protein